MTKMSDIGARWHSEALGTARSLLLGTLGLLVLGSVEAAEDAASGRLGLERQTELSLTVYNNDRALVRDRRSLKGLPTDLKQLRVEGVSARMEPATLVVEGAPVRAQNYDFKRLTPDSLLEAHQGRWVTVIAPARPGEKGWSARARVLSVANGRPLLTWENGRISGLEPEWRIEFDSVPETLHSRPTLSLELASLDPARELALNYLSSGLDWQADYVGSLGPENRQLRLTAWVTLTNRSGTSFRNAEVQLLAGEVNQVPKARLEALQSRTLQAAAPAREKLLGYHLYTLPYRVDLADEQQKQLALFQADAQPVQPFLEARFQGARLESRRGYKPEQRLRLVNEEPALGRPLPAGTLRLYRDDAAGRTQFLGEDAITHTAEGETLELLMGRSTNVSIDRELVAAEPLPGYVAQGRSLSWRLRLANTTAETRHLRIRENYPAGREWRLQDSSRPPSEKTAEALIWELQLPPESETLLEYRVNLHKG